MGSMNVETYSVKTRDQAEAAVALHAVLTVELNTAVNRQNAEILAARAKDKEINQLRERIGRYEQALKEWAEKHRQEFGESKSLEMRQGTLVFRLGNRVVNLLEGWSNFMALAKLRNAGKKFGEYIRVKEEIDRQRILSDSRPEVGKLKEKDLKRFGLVIEQPERFFVEPKLETPPTYA